jgi:hypothetical protein
MKRKRNKVPQTKRRKKKPDNPFLELQNAAFPSEAKQVQENNVLSKVLAFSEISHQRLDDDNDKFQKTVEDLLGYLETLDFTSTDSLLSPVDVANMLLLWAVKSLLYTFSHQHSGTQTSSIGILLYWKALRSSLQTLLSLKDDSRSELSGCLSQSALNKLVPYAAQVALDEKAGNDATVCYTLLVDQLYRPTMDSACHSLLPLVDERLSQSASMEDGSQVLSSKDHVRILESTLRLLQTLQGNSNPKKTFQLLADPIVLSVLSRWRLAKEGDEVGSNSIREIVRELLRKGLFSPLHHVEGFRSMNLVVPGIDPSTDTAKSGDASKPDGGKQKKTFHCYQETLFETVAALITDVAESTTDTDHIVAAVLVVPEIMNGFIEQSAIWERDYGGKAGNKGATFMAAVQFRLWSNLIWPIVVGLRKFVMIPSIGQGRLQREFDQTLFMMRSLRETLSLVLKHHIYRPSYQDKDNANFSFLETITTTCLDILGTARNVGTLSCCTIENECLQGLETLICLNHLVAHDRLPVMISACGLVNAGSEPEECADIQTRRKTLVASVVKTYQRLRQLDQLFRSLLEVADALRKSTTKGGEGGIQASSKQKKQALSSLRGLILENEVCAEFAAAVQKCPPGQIQELFGDLNKWIRIRSNEVNSGAAPSVGDTGSEDMSLVVTLFVLLIRNVRVDKHTAVGVATLCDEAIETAVRPLIVGHELKREALVLSGWLVDLRTRCAFWLDECKENSKEDSFDIFAVFFKDFGLANSSVDVNMMAYDTEHAEGSAKLNDSAYGPMLNEIQFLLCHRIRELHSSIYEDQRAELTHQEGSLRSSALVREARRLVNFVVARAECPPAQRSESSAVAVSGSRWKILAETASFWVPYSESKHVDSFLLWMFSTLSITEEDLSENANGSIRVYPRDDAVNSCVVAEEKRVAEALLRDSSFFEIPELITRFDATGLKCAMELLSIALSTRNGGKDRRNSIKIHGLELTSLSKDSNLLPSSLKIFGDAMSALSSKKAKLALKGRTIRLDLLSRALQIIQLLNGTPRASTSLLSVDMSLRLDILTSAICFESTAPEVETVVLPLLCAIRTYTGSSAVDHLHEFIDDTLLFFLRGYIQSTTAVMKRISSSNKEAHQTKVLRASGMLVEAITTSCLSHFKHSPEPLKTLFNCFKMLVVGDRVGPDEMENRALMNMTRSFVRRVVVLAGCNGLLDDGDFKSTVVKPFITAMQEAFCTVDMAHKSMLHDENSRAEWFLLMGDTTRLTALMVPSQTEMVDSSIIKRSLVCGEDDVTSRAANYYLACIVASGSVPHSATKLVIDQCLSGDAGCNQLNEATLCGIVRGMGFDEVYRLLELVLNKARTTDTCRLSSLRVFQLLLENVHDDLARIEVSRVSRSFFVMSLELLHPLDRPDVSSWASEVDLGTSLLITLTQQKDVIAIRERDLALMLAQVESALGEGGSFRNPNVSPVDGRVYSSCYMLVSSLLQRFPKQLHACVPSVVSTMHNLLRHVLYGELSDPEITQRAQIFTRLCELLIPHRDVYKKHVLGLILEFVGALRTNVHPSRSKGIVPAIYCLLDMLSQYETEQLNTMMDATAKTLFRSVYQSHQKTHRYKGQY